MDKIAKENPSSGCHGPSSKTTMTTRNSKNQKQY